ncbi:MAG: hypothetical protein ABR606_02925 [Vicinamibacterales bacterium]
MLIYENVDELLDRIGVLRHPCDLDLLVFLARHPRSLLSSESLASFLGYDLKEIAQSLGSLLDASLLKGTQTPSHGATLYVLPTDGSTDRWLSSLLALASSREGRLALREALARRSREGNGGPAGQTLDTTRPGSRRVVSLEPEDKSGTKTR